MRTTEFFKAFLLVDFKEDTQKSIRIVFSDPLKTCNKRNDALITSAVTLTNDATVSNTRVVCVLSKLCHKGWRVVGKPSSTCYILLIKYFTGGASRLSH